MINLHCEILIGRYRFRWANNVVIRKSFENYTQTATITMPNQLRSNNQYILEEFNEGDVVEIKLGYRPNLTTRFKGYLARKINGNPAIFECEDESWKLKKQGLAEYSKTGITLETLIKDNYSGAYSVENANIGDWQISEGSTLLQVFDELRNFGLFAYFDNEVLQVKAKSSIINETVHELSFQRNIIEGSELKFIKANEIGVVSYGVSKQANGTVISSYAYFDTDNKVKLVTSKPSGTLNKLSIPELTQTQLDELVVRRLPNLYHTGAIGSITTFGEPVLNIGDKVQLVDDKYSDKNGLYSTKGIEISFGVDGYRQVIEIDTKL